MKNPILILTCAAALSLGAPAPTTAQANATQPPARQQLQSVHTPQSIDQELARLTSDLELTANQQRAVRTLLQEHHDKLQALFDAHPTLSRQQLAP